MKPLGKLERETAALVIVDVQDALMRPMISEIRERVIKNIQILIASAREMAIPIFVTEQYPKGLGRTIPEIGIELGGVRPIEKLSFSCARVESFNRQLEASGREAVLLAGIETHVCIFQTAVDLIDKGYQVTVVADAICSRRKLDWQVGLKRLTSEGAILSTTEMIAFQLLKEAGTEEFKRLSKLFK